MTLPTRQEVQAQVESWIAANWTPEITVRAWWAELAAAGYASAALPTHAGGLGWPADLAAAAVLATLARANVLGPPGGLGLLLAAPTIATHGTPEQIEAWVPSILDGTSGWCQLFSEPQAGSDLAGLQTKAVRDGDEWVITGQKVWTSTAQTADRAMLIARTDPDAPSTRASPTSSSRWTSPASRSALAGDDWPGRVQRGVPRRRPGATRQHPRRVQRGLEGGQHHPGLRAGRRGPRWRHVHRRPARAPGRRPRQAGRSLRRRQGPIVGGAVGRRHLHALTELARKGGRVDDPVVRQAIARVHTDYEILRFMGWKAKMVPHQRTGVEANLAKVFNSSAVANARDAANLLLGPEGQLWESDGVAGMFQEMTLFSPAPPIYAGSDQVQRNVIGERGLGLPKEPGPAADTPFRELPKN
ncbi:MAG: acyl-CoA dehydrogenase family protein [Acidimicrobiales bacterium]